MDPPSPLPFRSPVHPNPGAGGRLAALDDALGNTAVELMQMLVKSLAAKDNKKKKKSKAVTNDPIGDGEDRRPGAEDNDNDSDSDSDSDGADMSTLTDLLADVGVEFEVSTIETAELDDDLEASPSGKTSQAWQQLEALGKSLLGGGDDSEEDGDGDGDGDGKPSKITVVKFNMAAMSPGEIQKLMAAMDAAEDDAEDDDGRADGKSNA